jgi:hypothetical protein
MNNYLSKKEKMPKSYRFRTIPGVDRDIRIKIDQDFDFLEILSLKLRQEDLYSRFCADYGVVAGRVIANGGYGVPNVNISIFVPLSNVDENNPIISTLYPYKTPQDKNEDGFRYNLLPYVQEYGGHTPTGTFPSKNDILTRKEVLEVYEKYYKYTVKTNESGDFMIVGVPLGQQKIVMDLDLSNIGQFSLRPSDLIRMGLGVESQFNGQQFKNSENIDSLPQIVHEVLDIDVSSFWGQQDLCDVGITRIDFDLRELGIEIVPTSVFMGSIFSSTDRRFLKRNCKPKTEQGDICELVTGPGEILAIRQTIFEDENNDPILEQYFLENGGKVIDNNGTFVTELPMNLDFVITNEFGEQILSNNPSVGIPTKSKYRFKIKYQSEENGEPINTSGTLLPIRGNIMRANFLVPQIREYGWIDSNTDPSTFSNPIVSITNPISPTTLNFNSPNEIETQIISIPSNRTVELINNNSYEKVEFIVNGVVRKEKLIDFPNGGNLEIKLTKKLNGGVFSNAQIQYKLYDYRYSQFQKSYAFSLDLNEYADKTAAIKCDDFFYEMRYNKIYTTAQLIDEYRNGNGRARFLGIKEVLDRTCESEINKFPINDGVRNFNLIYFLVNFLLTIFTPIIVVLIFLIHTICFLWPILRIVINILTTVVLTFIILLCYIVKGITFGLIRFNCPKFQTISISRNCPLTTIALPNLSYPECNFCNCPDVKPGEVEFPNVPSNNSLLVDSNEFLFYNKLIAIDSDEDIKESWMTKYLYGFQSVMSGFDDGNSSFRTRTPWVSRNDNPFTRRRTFSYDIPLTERLNLFNTKANYHHSANGKQNIINVRVNPSINNGPDKFYTDNVIMLVLDGGTESLLTPGQVITFQNIQNSGDVNVNNITGNTVFNSVNTQVPINITYMETNISAPATLNSVTKSFIITGDTNSFQEYVFPSDVEYFQVITGQTLSNFENLLNNNIKGSNVYPTNSTRFLGNFTIFGWQKVVRTLETSLLVDFPIFYPDDTTNLLDSGKFETNVPNIKLQDDWENLNIVFLVRGVDPNTPRQEMEYDLSNLYGNPLNTNVVKGQYRLNIPIQPYNTTTDWRLPKHNQIMNNDGLSHGQRIFYPSFTFTPSPTEYTTYKTKNHQFYSAYDFENRYKIGNNNSVQDVGNSIGNTNNAVSVSNQGNWRDMTGPNQNSSNKYRNNEVVEGVGVMVSRGEGSGVDRWRYYSPVYYNLFPNHEITMSDSSRIVMRTDRLPTSDTTDRRFVLHQNKNFSIYLVDDQGEVTSLGVGSDNNGFDNEEFGDIPGQVTSKIISSFSCENMVPLTCYSGDSESFGLFPETNSCYWVGRRNEGGIRVLQNGCYYLVRTPFKNIGQDLRSFSEWKSRFRMMYALCSNVIGMSFVNNWINGSLYMYGFQKSDRYSTNPNVSKFLTNPDYEFCSDTIVFQEINNSFFYRSSPYNGETFIGKTPPKTNSNFYSGSNQKLLGNPTTIMDLGPKDEFIKEITFNSEYLGFVVNDIPSTTYKDTSDILQLFVISRLANSNFWQQVTGLGDASIGKLFSRTNSRIDGDLAQLVSINSEFGVFPFLGNNYSDNQISYNQDSNGDPTVGIFFSSNTQTRDYITPGRETFVDTFLTYRKQEYGFKDQNIPYYKWNIKPTPDQGGISSNYIFGTEKNDWYIKENNEGFGVVKYQSVDRLINNPTFQTQQINPTTNRPGYIFNSSETNIGNITYLEGGVFTPQILVGLPYHFYFGLKIGETSMNSFIKRYVFNQETL